MTVLLKAIMSQQGCSNLLEENGGTFKEFIERLEDEEVPVRHEVVLESSHTLSSKVA